MKVKSGRGISFSKMVQKGGVRGNLSKLIKNHCFRKRMNVFLYILSRRKKADEPVFPGPNRLTSVHNSTTAEV